MKIKDLLAYEAIDVQAFASSKEEIINKAIDLMVKSGKITDRQAYAKKVFEREEESTTGVGMGSPFPMDVTPLWQKPVWLPWLFRTAWNTSALMLSQFTFCF